MDALKRSIADEKKQTPAPKKGRKRIAGQGEMLLAIPGKKGKEAVAEPVAKSSVRRKRAG